MKVGRAHVGARKGIGLAGVVYTTLAILVEIGEGPMASADEKAPGIRGLFLSVVKHQYLATIGPGANR
jgi:hypothetical protein